MTERLFVLLNYATGNLSPIIHIRDENLKPIKEEFLNGSSNGL